MGGNIIVNSFGPTDASSPAANIAGNLSLGTGTRTITLNASPVYSNAPSEELVISANIAATAAAVTTVGGGTLALTGTAAYTGITTIGLGGELNLRDNVAGTASGTAAGTTFVVGVGATLQIDDSLGNDGNRIKTTGTVITLNGGTFNYIGNASGSSESLGSILLNSGASTIQSTTTGGGIVTLTSAACARSQLRPPSSA